MMKRHCVTLGVVCAALTSGALLQACESSDTFTVTDMPLAGIWSGTLSAVEDTCRVPLGPEFAGDVIYQVDHEGNEVVVRNLLTGREARGAFLGMDEINAVAKPICSVENSLVLIIQKKKPKRACTAVLNIR